MTEHHDRSAESCDLKPCPFCGGPAHFYENEVDFVSKWSVGCDECPAGFDACEDTKAEVAAFWNHRPRAPAQAVGMREALERIAKQQLVEERLVEGGDYEYGYEQIVKIARVALASQPSPAAPVETCSNCNGTKRATYYSEQASAHEERDCHVCRPQCSAETEGCGTPGCTDPNCDYGKGPLRCQSCGAVVVGEPQPAAVREALELAEDVLSRAPFSTAIWPNGMHPNRGIEKIRAALRSRDLPQRSAGNAGVIRLLTKIADLVDNEDVCEPLDDAIHYANEALAILNEPRASAATGDELDFSDPLTNKIMGAARLHTHDHTMAYAITREVLAVIRTDPQGAGK